MSKPKPFEIDREVVKEAYLRVRANKGAAGVDGESIEEFEKDLEGNLYKLWNRMSSGSYLPPPVRMAALRPGLDADGLELRMGTINPSGEVELVLEARQRPSRLPGARGK